MSCRTRAESDPPCYLGCVGCNANRAPMLVIAGSIDHVVPPVTARAIVRYNKKRSSAVTEYKEFSGRTHFLAGQAGWEEIPDYALEWAQRNALGVGVTRPQLAVRRSA